MGGIYSKVNRLRIDEKQNEIKQNDFKNEKSFNEQPTEQKTPCSTIPKYLLDPRSATAEIKRTPIVVMREAQDEGGDCTPVGALPYLETDLDCSICTIRTSTPILSASPMKELLQTSPVLGRSDFDGYNAEEGLDEVFYLDSEDEDVKEQLFNNERMLFESQDQGSFNEENDAEEVEDNDDDELHVNDNSCLKDDDDESNVNSEIYLLSEDSNEISNDTNEIQQAEENYPTTENSLDRQFSEIEECVFSAVNPAAEDTSVKNPPPNVLSKFKVVENHLVKTKTGRTPLGFVSSNPCSPLQPVNVIINKDVTDVGKTWRGLNEERVNRGLLDVENTPPPSSLPPPDIIQSAPGKLLLANRGRTGKATWGRDSSLII